MKTIKELARLNEIYASGYKLCKKDVKDLIDEIENVAGGNISGIIDADVLKARISGECQESTLSEMPKPFNKGKCKCGDDYGYIGLDIGYCVKCIDNLKEDDTVDTKKALCENCGHDKSSHETEGFIEGKPTGSCYRNWGQSGCDCKKFQDDTLKAPKVYIEDAEEFSKQSKTYRKILEHRRNCKHWGKGFCLKCFGGGLTTFNRQLQYEFTPQNKDTKSELERRNYQYGELSNKYKELKEKIKLIESEFEKEMMGREQAQEELRNLNQNKCEVKGIVDNLNDERVATLTKESSPKTEINSKNSDFTREIVRPKDKKSEMSPVIFKGCDKHIPYSCPPTRCGWQFNLCDKCKEPEQDETCDNCEYYNQNFNNQEFCSFDVLNHSGGEEALPDKRTCKDFTLQDKGERNEIKN